MASAFGHALTAIALGTSYNKRYLSLKFFTLGIICSILPDADVIGFHFDVDYGSFWGHRGFSHSLLFALFIGFLISYLFYRKNFFKFTGLGLSLYFFLCTASHSILDGMTTGGLGVAFLSPFDTTRYFLPWRPIAVSPIGIDNFNGEWATRVLSSEAVWIGLPSILFILLIYILKKSFSKK